MKHTAEEYIAQLGLAKHIEGGYFKELYKNSRTINRVDSTADGEAERTLSSTIYYLLKSGQVSRFHKLQSDELWFFHAGSPLCIHTINAEGNLATLTLGLSVDQGEQPQVLIPAGTIFGAEVSEKNSFTLVSCMVSPGFDYHDFYLYTADELTKQFPAHSTIITRLNS